ncbi:Cysteine--tRNA ligase [Galdieria sulphuraria]|uniref:cysteine--tRNA ligase n=1 Tax=Galdieria sulphuraria TaxID=130081 RepID=M2X7W2_GALSU|nr:cysteinyl-tRNA synthetase [Galdieria sulphuraria]EME25917.1 cysteinyl-tRNA synthetase [Galdieria sulphuraria]GJD09066.1 Cysteine--tRNA ligase [Galdieria sulphuraria]|eukprot:XP_005702437.1 cysteinyl-tRNA synthetase [Galdieria sulphuraria]
MENEEEKDDSIRWYVCGPTVYDEAHIGHARTFVALDIIRRVVEDFFRLPCIFAMNITDIDDKILEKAKEERVPFEIISERYTKKFFQDMRLLRVRKPDIVLKVTDHIPCIISFIQGLVEKGYTYETADGIYFDVNKYPFYGYFRQCGNLIPKENREKKDPRDFVLWKKSPSLENVPGWNSPFGKGRPGWHTECAAMIHEVFGDRLDFHGGGVDLSTIHHENEIAQMSCFLGKGWVPNWIHVGHLSIRGCKMSKSLRNFVTIREAIESKQMDAEEFRVFCLLHNFNCDVEFGEDEICEAKRTWSKLKKWNEEWSYAEKDLCSFFEQKAKKETEETEEWGEKADDRSWKTEIFIKLRNNFQTREVMLLILQECKKTLQLKAQGCFPWDTCSYIYQLLLIFGLKFPAWSLINKEQELIGLIVTFREKIRVALSSKVEDQQLRKDIFAICDELRDQDLKRIGIHLEDLKD